MRGSATRAGVGPTSTWALLLGAALLAPPPATAQTQAELQGYQLRLERLFQRLDLNGDQRLERREVESHPYLRKHFSRLDQQRRGYLTPTDLRPTASGSDRERARSFIDRTDRNNDGVLDRQEAEVYPWLQRRFRDADRNSDGVIGPEELKHLRDDNGHAGR